MKYKEKNFKCTKCGTERYTDSDECQKCGVTDGIVPIARAVYACYLNGVLYGKGNLDYMRELFTDYVVTCEMYGKKMAEFKIIEEDLK